METAKLAGEHTLRRRYSYADENNSMARLQHVFMSTAGTPTANNDKAICPRAL